MKDPDNTPPHPVQDLIIYPIQRNPQNSRQQKEKKQPGGQGLEEILLKSTEKGLGGSVEIPFDAAQHTVVQSSQRRADGENWNAAEYKEKIAYDHISDLI